MQDNLNRYPVHWIKNTNNGQYFDLLKLDLNSNYFINKRGVYVIWYTTPTGGKAIYVGQGNIGERLREHRDNWRITQYSKYGQLKTTWAIVPEGLLNAIEAGLYFDYSPPENENKFSTITPLYVTQI